MVENWSAYSKWTWDYLTNVIGDTYIDYKESKFGSVFHYGKSSTLQHERNFVNVISQGGRLNIQFIERVNSRSSCIHF
jgi:hypothetical protein